MLKSNPEAKRKEPVSYTHLIRFDGNGYCDEWKAEAARRGLDCENSVPLQYDAYLKPEVIRMFRETGVLSEKELEARNEVKWEIYIKKVQIEARVLGDLSMNHIIPVVLHYQSLLLSNITKLKETFSPEEYEELSAEPRRLVRKISKHVNAVTRMTDEMIEARKKANVITDYRSKAIAYHDTVVPFLDDIRAVSYTHLLEELAATLDENDNNVLFVGKVKK